MSKFWIGTSWKMNKTLAEAKEWAGRLAEDVSSPEPADLLDHVQPFVMPSFTATTLVRDVLGENSPVLLGVQNAHWEDAGAWTGEVSMPQAKDAGAQMVEIGHSERREHFGETIETTRLKVRAALEHGLISVLCVGESAQVKEAGASSKFIREEADGALDGLSDAELGQVIIAYEPIWAIGDKGRPATAEELEEPFAALGEKYTGNVKSILYGGSVNLDNAAEMLGIEHATGLFVGRTAWNIDGYLKLLRIGRECAA